MVKKAQGVVKDLAASRRIKRSEPAVSCSEVNTIAMKLINEVTISPASPEILVFSNTIIASGTVVCTVAEKVSLAEVDPLFEEAVVKLETEIETASGKVRCLYQCQDGGGCTVDYTGPLRAGAVSTSGSCFSRAFGGSCKGTPAECRDCNKVSGFDTWSVVRSGQYNTI